MRGILAIRNDCARGLAATYEEWYQDEHLIERLCVSGFCVGRRYEAVVATRQFLTTYEMERLEYLERPAHPTERTAAIMQSGFSNACRTVCERRRCLALEFLRHEPALRAADNMRRAYVDAEIGVYRLPCSLRTEDLA
jgi:hypothetical protein